MPTCPYQLVGGTKFYERREIKDALAYLQAIVNPADNVNVRRILNVPKRGLGVRAEGLVASYADAHGTTFFEAIEHMEQIEGMSTRTTKPLSAFRDMMHELAAFAKDHDTKPSEVVAEVLAKSGILEELQRSEDPQDASRVDNLSQLQSVAAEFEQNTPDATLAGFLETTALVADSDQLPGENEDSGKVTMMTLHTAKGLEYPYVFLTRHGARHIPTPACHGRHQRTGRGAPSRLRGHHSREATPVCDTRGRTRAMGASQRHDAQSVPR